MVKKKIKRNPLFKNKMQMILHIMLYTVVLILFIYIGNVNFDDGKSDQIIIDEEFKDIGSDNVFDIYFANEVLELIKSEGFIVFGYTQNKFTEDFLIKINDLAKDNNVAKVAYYDFYDDRLNQNGNYQLIVEYLSDYLYTDDNDKQELYAPTFLAFKDGKVIYMYDELNFIKGNITSDDFWTEYNTINFENGFESAVDNFIGEVNGE